MPRNPRPRRRVLPVLTLCASFAALNAVSFMAVAQVPASEVLAPQQIQTYELPAGSLAASLNALARQAGLTLSVSPAIIEGKTAPIIAGEYTAQQVLQQLLQGSGVEFSFTGKNTVVLSESASSVSGGLRTLAPAVVNSASDETTYVASESSIGKTDTPLIETPRSISVITADQISDQNAGDLGAVFRYTSGIYSELRGAVTTRDELVIRGFRAGNYVSRDGLFDADRETNAEPVPYGLERVVLLKGPASVLYGQGSPGGIVSTITKRPTEEFFAEVGIDYGSFNQLGGQFDVGGALDEDKKFLFRLTGEKRNGDTQVDYTENNHLYIAPALTWQLSEKTSLTLLTTYKKQEGTPEQFLPASGLVLSNPNGKISTSLYQGDPSVSDNISDIEREGYTVSYLFEHQWNDNMLIRHNARYTDASWARYNFAYGGAVQADQRTIDREFYVGRNDLKAFVTDTHVQFTFESGAIEHTALVGAGYKQNKGHGDWGFASGFATLDLFNPVYGVGVFPTSLPDHQWDEDWKQTQYGIYAQDQIKFSNKLVLTIGGRHDWAEYKSTDNLESSKSKDNDKAFTGQAGLLYLFDSGLSPYVSYAESFEPKSGTDFYGNEFDPTTGTQYEVGIKYQPIAYNSLYTLSLFDLRQQNVTTTDPVNINFSIQTGELRSRGIELEARVDLSNNLKIIANYSYTDIEVTKSNDENLGKRPTRVPSELASIWVDYTLFSGLGVSVGVRYVGNQAGDPTNTFEVPSFTLVDAAIHYEATQGALKNITFSLNASNLLDKTYVSTCEDLDWCLYGARSNVTARVTRKF